MNLRPLQRGMPAVCECGAKLADPSECAHVHHCKLVKPVPCTIRHNTVVSALASVIRAAGLSPIVEPRRMPSSEDDKKRKRLRPDIMVYGHMETLLIDVSLVHPQSPSYVRAHKDDDTRREQRIIQRRDQQKRDKYRLLAKLHDNGRVVPFVVDASVWRRLTLSARSAPFRRAMGVLNVACPWRSAGSPSLFNVETAS